MHNCQDIEVNRYFSNGGTNLHIHAIAQGRPEDNQVEFLQGPNGIVNPPKNRVLNNIRRFTMEHIGAANGLIRQHLYQCQIMYLPIHQHRYNVPSVNLRHANVSIKLQQFIHIMSTNRELAIFTGYLNVSSRRTVFVVIFSLLSRIKPMFTTYLFCGFGIFTSFACDS